MPVFEDGYPRTRRAAIFFGRASANAHASGRWPPNVQRTRRHARSIRASACCAAPGVPFDFPPGFYHAPHPRFAGPSYVTPRVPLRGFSGDCIHGWTTSDRIASR